MENKSKLIVGGFMFFSVFLGAGLGELIDQDTQLWTCESKDLISDCVNGVKADGLRCYYNESNSRAYTYCKEGWEEHNIEIKQLEYPPVVVQANGGIYSCPTEKARINSYTKCTKNDGKQTYLGEII